jgi:hypothetical protein
MTVAEGGKVRSQALSTGCTSASADGNSYVMSLTNHRGVSTYDRSAKSDSCSRVENEHYPPDPPSNVMSDATNIRVDALTELPSQMD